MVILLIIITLLLFLNLCVLVMIGAEVRWYMGLIRKSVKDMKNLEGIYISSEQGSA